MSDNRTTLSADEVLRLECLRLAVSMERLKADDVPIIAERLYNWLTRNGDKENV